MRKSVGIIIVVINLFTCCSGCNNTEQIEVDGDYLSDADANIDGDMEMEIDADPESVVIIPEGCRDILTKVSGSNNCYDEKCAYALLEENREFTSTLILDVNRGDVDGPQYSSDELEHRRECLGYYLESVHCSNIRKYSLTSMYARCDNSKIEEVVQMPVIRATRVECQKGDWCICLNYDNENCLENPFCRLINGSRLNKELDCWEDPAPDVCSTNTEFSTDPECVFQESYCVKDSDGECYSVSACEYNSAYVDWNIDPWCCAGWRDNCRNLADGDADPYTAEQCGDVQPLYVTDMEGVDLFNFESECHHIRHQYEELYLTETCTVVSVGTTFPGAVFYCLPIDDESRDETVYSWLGPRFGCGVGSTSISRVPGWHAIGEDSGIDVLGCVAAVNDGNFDRFTTRQEQGVSCEDSQEYYQCIVNINLPYYCQAMVGWPVEYRDGACMIHDPLTDAGSSLDDGVYVGCRSVLPFSHAMPVPLKYTGLIRNRETGQCLGVIEPFAFVEDAMPQGWEPADCSDCLPGNTGDGDGPDGDGPDGDADACSED